MIAVQSGGEGSWQAVTRYPDSLFGMTGKLSLDNQSYLDIPFFLLKHGGGADTKAGRVALLGKVKTRIRQD